MLVLLKSYERGLLLRDGVPVSLLQPGRHRFWFAKRLRVGFIDIDAIVTKWTPELGAVLNGDEATVVSVTDREVALVTVDSVAKRVLDAGKYVVWTCRQEVKIDIINVDEVFPEIRDPFWPLMSTDKVAVKVVHPYESVLMYVDGELHSVMSAGRYLISRYFRTVTFETYDTREQDLIVAGQDLMTLDKVTIRVNLIVKYRVVDARKAVETVKDVQNALYTLLQIAARNFIGGVTVDGLLEGRNELAEALFEAMSKDAKLWGVEILGADLKDIILPGDMKSILNQVIFAEKKAQANLITRREETAATRSLANTAKMFEKNPMLLRLKELDAMQTMVSNAENLTIVTSKDKILDIL